MHCPVCQHKKSSHNAHCVYCGGEKLCKDVISCQYCQDKSFYFSNKSLSSRWDFYLNDNTDMLSIQQSRNYTKKHWFKCTLCNHSIAHKIHEAFICINCLISPKNLTQTP